MRRFELKIPSLRSVGTLTASLLVLVVAAGCCCTQSLCPTAPCSTAGASSCGGCGEPVADLVDVTPAPEAMTVPTNDRPPEAQPGEAWCRVWVPPVNETVTETVMVEPAKKRKLWIPPEYGTRMKIVCVSQASIKEVTHPGIWDVRHRQVVDCPEREVFQKTSCGTDECGCPQDCVVARTCPPTYRTVSERICIAPPRSQLKYTPAQYKCVPERYLIKEGFCQETCVPARYETRTRTVCRQPGRWSWERRDECEIPVPVCEEPPAPETLPALEVRMEDKSADGVEQGIFRRGDEVRYELVVLSDVASESMPDMKVVFELPEHLEFVSGGGAGLAIDGAGQSATSSNFSLSVGETRRLHLVARVKTVPPANLVQVSASVQTLDGVELALEIESTTLAEAN